MTTPFLDTARRVIRAEAEALETLADMLDDRFRAAIDLMRTCKGRIIVTGIGKSGHIAKKIAATLASTGTPAQFVHPAEASHGDLGMITSDDVVLAISNSGEAPELGNLIAYSRRFDIPLIGMTSRAGSALGSQSDVILELPQLGEACGTGAVPHDLYHHDIGDGGCAGRCVDGKPCVYRRTFSQLSSRWETGRTA